LQCCRRCKEGHARSRLHDHDRRRGVEGTLSHGGHVSQVHMIASAVDRLRNAPVGPAGCAPDPQEPSRIVAVRMSDAFSRGAARFADSIRDSTDYGR
jgi:hypothetical protein